MNQDESTLAFLTDFSKFQDTVTKAEFEQYKSNWSIQLNNSTGNGPMGSRADYHEAVALKNHLYRNSEDYQKPIHLSTRTDDEKVIIFQKLVVKGYELIRKLGGHFGQVHHILHNGGRVINGTGITTTQKAWQTIRNYTNNFVSRVFQRFINSLFMLFLTFVNNEVRNRGSKHEETRHQTQ